MLCLLVVYVAYGESKYYEKYEKLVDAKDTAALAKLIPEWEKAEGSTGDVYAAWFNYYVLCHMVDGVSLTKIQPEGEALALQDSTGNIAAYLGGHTIVFETGMKLGLAKINEGIAKYPDRLDLAFGKVHLLLDQYRYDEALKELHRVLDRSVVNKNQWKWTNDGIPYKPGDGQVWFRSCLQDYFTQLYNQNLDSVALAFADDVIQHYPKSVYFLSNKAAIYSQTGKVKEALDIFVKVHELDPSDDIVTYNIAFLNEKIDKKKSIKYYRQLLKSKDEGIKADATRALEELSR